MPHGLEQPQDESTLSRRAGAHPQVSVIIPCRNESRYLDTLLQSIERQTYPRESIDLLFVDGMSTDNTVEILRHFEANRPHVRIMCNPSQYVPHAMNIGIREARGEFIVRLDAHATYVESYLEMLITAGSVHNAQGPGHCPCTCPSPRRWQFTVSHWSDNRYGN